MLDRPHRSRPGRYEHHHLSKQRRLYPPNIAIVQVLLESMAGITQRTSPTDPDVKLSPHPAPRYS